MLKVAIGADDAATTLKNQVKTYLQEKGSRSWTSATTLPATIKCTRTSPLTSPRLFARGNLNAGYCCAALIGMAIVANKVPGIRAAQCHDVYSASRARKSNNAQIMTLGARVIGSELALTIVDSWLDAEFEAGRSASKVERIAYYENKVHTHNAQ